MPNTNPTSINKKEKFSKEVIASSGQNNFLFALPTEISQYVVSFFDNATDLARIKKVANTTLVAQSPLCRIMDMVDQHFPHHYQRLFHLLRQAERKEPSLSSWEGNHRILAVLIDLFLSEKINSFLIDKKKYLHRFQKKISTFLFDHDSSYDACEQQQEKLIKEACKEIFRMYGNEHNEHEFLQFQNHKKVGYLCWHDNYQVLDLLYKENAPMHYSRLSNAYQYLEALVKEFQYYQHLFYGLKQLEQETRSPDPCHYYYKVLEAYDSRSYLKIFNQINELKSTNQPLSYLEECFEKLFTSECLKEWFVIFKKKQFTPVKLDMKVGGMLYFVRDQQSLSPFDWAIRRDNQEVLNYFWRLAQPATLMDVVSVGGRDFETPIESIYGITQLHWVIACQQPLSLLNVNQMASRYFLIADSTGQSALHYAAHNKNLDWLYYLVKRFNRKSTNPVNLADLQGNTPLLTAALVGNLDAVDFLIKNNAAIDVKNSQGQSLVSLLKRQIPMRHQDKQRVTVWHIAAQYLPMDDFPDLLATRFAEINIANEQGDTPLHFAVLRADIDVIKFLIKHGADVNQTNTWGIVPIHLAAQIPNPEIAQLLLEQGAKIVVDKENRSPYLHAAWAGNIAGMEVFTHQFIHKEMTINEQNALHLVAESGNLDAINYLLSKGFSVNSMDNSGNTPLDLAFKNKDKQMVLALLRVEPNWHSTRTKELKKILKNEPFLKGLVELKEYIAKLKQEQQTNKSSFFNRTSKLPAKLAAAEALAKVVVHDEDTALLINHEKILNKKGSTLYTLTSVLFTNAAETLKRNRKQPLIM